MIATGVSAVLKLAARPMRCTAFFQTSIQVRNTGILRNPWRNAFQFSGRLVAATESAEFAYIRINHIFRTFKRTRFNTMRPRLLRTLSQLATHLALFAITRAYIGRTILVERTREWGQTRLIVIGFVRIRIEWRKVVRGRFRILRGRYLSFGLRACIVTNAAIVVICRLRKHRIEDTVAAGGVAQRDLPDCEHGENRRSF